MEQVTAFKASDGALFGTAAECQEYEISLTWRAKMNDFTASGMNPYATGAHAGMCRKIIVAWENFKLGAA